MQQGGTPRNKKYEYTFFFGLQIWLHSFQVSSSIKRCCFHSTTGDLSAGRGSVGFHLIEFRSWINGSHWPKLGKIFEKFSPMAHTQKLPELLLASQVPACRCLRGTNLGSLDLYQRLNDGPPVLPIILINILIQKQSCCRWSCFAQSRSTNQQFPVFD